MNYELLDTEKINLDTAIIDECSTEEILKLINAEDKKVPFAVEKEIPQISAAVDRIYVSLKNGGKLFYIGAGTSGRLGVLDASECPPTFGVDPELVQGYIAGGDIALRKAVEGCEDNEADGKKQMVDCGVTNKDVVVGITASGSAAYVIGAIKKARELGAGVIGITNNRENGFSEYCDICITPICGPEVISGSTRMKAGSSQKMVLNMLTTSVMIKLGKVYGNRMVDLRATNKKLVKRAIHMICEVTDVLEEEAKEWLEKAGGSSKLAIMCILSGKNVEEAKEILDHNDGYLKKALSSANM